MKLLMACATIPLEVAEFVAAQIGVKGIDLAGHAETDVTRRRHLVDLRSIYGYCPSSYKVGHQIGMGTGGAGAFV